LRTSLVYTRGFGDGFLGGSDHQTLVEGRFPKHRGVLLGRVVAVGRGAVTVTRDPDGRPWTGGRAAAATIARPLGAPSAALRGLGGADDASGGARAADLEPRPGMGVVFDAGHPEDKSEPGGPVFAVESTRDGWILRFGQPGPDLGRVAPGQRVWVTSDPTIARETERLVEADEPTGRIALVLAVRGAVGDSLAVVATAGDARAEAASASPLVASSGAGLTADLLRDKLAAFGGTPFRLDALDTEALAPGLHLPVSELKLLRRTLAAALLARIERGPGRPVAPGSFAPRLRAARRKLAPSRRAPPERPELVALCRTAAQLEAVIASGAREVELDWMELVGLGKAVARARSAGLHVTLATVRVQKSSEEGYDRRLAALAPDAVLVRHWGALVAFQALGASGTRPLLHGDFSLNVTNSITAAELFDRGLDTLTASHDLDRAQLMALLDAAPPERFTVVLHHRIATFHTEHCVYAHLLSGGRDYRTCGRPCEQHEIALRDHKGRSHPVIVDVGCRNTVFNDELQSAADLVPELARRGVRRFRVELVRETQPEAARALAAYGDLLNGRIDPETAIERAGARGHFGVSPAPMTLMR
jgi:putative protease